MMSVRKMQSEKARVENKVPIFETSEPKIGYSDGAVDGYISMKIGNFGTGEILPVLDTLIRLHPNREVEEVRMAFVMSQSDNEVADSSGGIAAVIKSKEAHRVSLELSEAKENLEIKKDGVYCKDNLDFGMEFTIAVSQKVSGEGEFEMSITQRTNWLSGDQKEKVKEMLRNEAKMIVGGIAELVQVKRD
jgi:hypothetical protein